MTDTRGRPVIVVRDGAPVDPDDTPLRLRVAHVDQANTVLTASDGDLWPAAWASDGSLYAAAGDGTGFARHGWSDILVNRIDGTPAAGLTGERLADGDAVAPIWEPGRFNRKPTGMVCVDLDGHDVLYLAVQDLRSGEGPDVFNEAPTATIVRSDDLGRTWYWPERPLFTGHVFTTVMFLDLGRANSGSPWVYAYGIDGNWRTSFRRSCPTRPRSSSAGCRRPGCRMARRWEFFAGFGDDGEPSWTADIGAKAPVLVDERRFYPDARRSARAAPDVTCIAQGGVVWNAGLGRYLYSTWSEYTFEFFEAPAPWGPWRLLHSHDFGHFPWHGPRSPLAKHGGYAPTMPSKFISEDGRDLWLQSNWFVPASSRGGRAYCFGLRRVRFDPGGGEPVGAEVDGAEATSPSTEHGRSCRACARGRSPCSTTARASTPRTRRSARPRRGRVGLHVGGTAPHVADRLRARAAGLARRMVRGGPADRGPRRRRVGRGVGRHGVPAVCE